MNFEDDSSNDAFTSLHSAKRKLFTFDNVYSVYVYGCGNSGLQLQYSTAGDSAGALFSLCKRYCNRLSSGYISLHQDELATLVELLYSSEFQESQAGYCKKVIEGDRELVVEKREVAAQEWLMTCITQTRKEKTTKLDVPEFRMFKLRQFLKFMLMLARVRETPLEERVFKQELVPILIACLVRKRSGNHLVTASIDLHCMQAINDYKELEELYNHVVDLIQPNAIVNLPPKDELIYLRHTVKKVYFEKSVGSHESIKPMLIAFLAGRFFSRDC